LYFNDLEIFVWNIPLVLREFCVTLREFNPAKPPVLGVVTLRAISLILAIDQQAKWVKSRASVFAVFGKFRSIGLSVTTPPEGLQRIWHPGAGRSGARSILRPSVRISTAWPSVSGVHDTDTSTRSISICKTSVCAPARFALIDLGCQRF
jgi:hypothetical protein